MDQPANKQRTNLCRDAAPAGQTLVPVVPAVAVAVMVPMVPLNNHRLTPLVDDDRLALDVNRLLPMHHDRSPIVNDAPAQQQRQSKYTAMDRQSR